MKPFLRLLLAALCLLGSTTPGLRAAPEPANAPKIKLTFVNAEQFTDILVDGMISKSGTDLVFSELNRHLAMLARRHLAPGQTLVLSVRDIDLAGVVEPWRGPDFGRVRYLRDTHPPRLAFDYQLLGADGTVAQEGAERLTNLTFRYQISTTTTRDTTYYEQQLLTDWMGATFAAPKKAKTKP